MSEEKIRPAADTQMRKDDQQSIERPWFFVGLLPSGVSSKESSESPVSFRPALDKIAIGWVDYVTGAEFDKEALAAAVQVGFSAGLVSALLQQSPNSYQDNDSELGIRLPSVQVRGLEVEAPPLLILIRKNVVCTIHPHSVDRRFSQLRRYGDTILKKIPADTPDTGKLSMLVARIIDHNSDRNFEHLRQIEAQGDNLNAILMDPNAPRVKLGTEIYRLKHAILVYLDALWSTVDVIDTIRYGDAELISDDPKLLDKFRTLGEDVNRQMGLAEHMSEVLSSGLQVLQTIHNNELQNLNNRLALLMTYLTIIGTAVLVPNTLATILGNSVFSIGPEGLGWYLALMIGSTVVATLLVYLWVRKLGWIPKKMD